MHTMRADQALLSALVFSFLSLPLQTTLGAQSGAAAAERLTFVAPKAPKNMVDGDRLALTINRWSTDAERDRVLATIKESGSEKLLDAFRETGAVGYLRWPGGLEYPLRYARRTPRPDGGADVVLVAERPLWVWWDAAVPPKTDAAYGAVHLRLGKDGSGEGRVTTPDALVANEVSGVAFKDPASQPALLTDVRRERTSS